jgi:hypothetical protein
MNDGVWFVDYLKTPVLNFIPSSTFDAQARLLERNRGALLEYASRARTTADLARCTWALWYHNTWVRRMLWPANAEWAKNVLEERSRLEALLIPELEFRARTRPAQPTSSPSSGETARGS